MASDVIKLTLDTANTGKQLDCFTVTVGGTVYRQVNCIGDPDTGGSYATVDLTSGALPENAERSLRTVAHLYGLDTAAAAGSQQVPLKVVSTAQPDLRVAPYGGGAALFPTAAAAADALANPTVSQAGAIVSHFNGTTWDRSRSGSAANISASSGIGAHVVTPPGNWSVVHTPVSATQATVTKAAGAAGVRHIAKGIYATLSTVGTAQTVIQLNLRDGTTGAGTILWSKSIQLPTNGLWEVNVENLNIAGTAATALSCEFSAAGVAASVQSVTLAGYDAS